jgi:hypothetical protein
MNAKLNAGDTVKVNGEEVTVQMVKRGGITMFRTVTKEHGRVWLSADQIDAEEPEAPAEEAPAEEPAPARTITRYWTVAKDLRRKYRGAYERGWNHSNDADCDDRSLDNNPCSGDLYWAWEDGYLDAAAGREHGHLLTEHDHNLCP